MFSAPPPPAARPWKSLRRAARPIAAMVLLALGWAGFSADAGAGGEGEGAYLVEGGKVDRGTYTGWQIFRENCARCHGEGATGSGLAPALGATMSRMSIDQFRVRVLDRYFITVPLGEAVSEGSAAMREAMEEIAQRGENPEHSPGDMPLWRTNPDVTDHIPELYAYLTARADGVLGPGVPELAEP